MEKLKELLNKLVESFKLKVEGLMSPDNIKFYALLLIAGIVGTWYTYNYAIEFSDFFIALLFMVIFAGLFHWYDVNALKSIDTLDEIKKGNTAVSQFLIAVALLLLAVAHIVG